MPVLQSVSVVPVGLTKFREGLYPLEPFNKEDAGEVHGYDRALSERFFMKNTVFTEFMPGMSGIFWRNGSSRRQSATTVIIQYGKRRGHAPVPWIDGICGSPGSTGAEGKGRELPRQCPSPPDYSAAPVLKAAGRPGAGRNTPMFTQKFIRFVNQFFRGADHCGRSSDFPGPEGTAVWRKIWASGCFFRARL